MRRGQACGMQWYLILLGAFDFEMMIGFVYEDDDWFVEPFGNVE